MSPGPGLPARALSEACRPRWPAPPEKRAGVVALIRVRALERTLRANGHPPRAEIRTGYRRGVLHRIQCRILGGYLPVRDLVRADPCRHGTRSRCSEGAVDGRFVNAGIPLLVRDSAGYRRGAPHRIQCGIPSGCLPARDPSSEEPQSTEGALVDTSPVRTSPLSQI